MEADEPKEDRQHLFEPAMLVPDGFFDEDQIPTRVIVIIESEEETGTHLQLLVSSGCQVWQALGLLKGATLTLEKVFHEDT